MNGKKIGYLPSASFDSMSVKEVCTILKGIGYDSVEWQIGVLNPRTHSPAELQDIVDQTKTCGLDISEVVIQRELVVADEAVRRGNIGFCKECVEALSEVGIHTLNFFTGPMPWIPNPLIVGQGISEGAAWGMLFDAFDEILPLAEKQQTNIAVENVWGMLCHDFFTTKHLIDHYDSPYMGVNYDPSHDILAGHTDIPWIIRSWGEQIKHIHLKDAVGIPRMGKFIFPLLGEGNVNWKEFFIALDKIGYQGYMSVEFESFDYVSRIFKGDWKKAAQIAYDNLSLLLQD